MKGLLRGLRYISHVFEEGEKEAEIQIGYPTDVKHVAHIGWDGPSASAPTWMNDFKSSNGDENKDEEALKNVSPDSTKNRVRDSPGRDLPINLPKSSRRQPSTDSLGSLDSPTASPKSSKTSRRRPKHKESSSPKAGESSSSQGGAPNNIPKKSRRKKSKDEDSTHSSKSKERSRRGSRLGSDDGSVKQFGSDSELMTSPREEDQG